MVDVLSLSTVADASTYFGNRLYSGIWTNASDDSQQQALNDATRIINRFAYIGQKTLSTQPNSWPRMYVVLDGVVLDSSVVPAKILEAQYEIAMCLLSGYDPEKDMRNSNVVSRGYSSVRVAYDPKLAVDFLRWGIPSGVAWSLMLPFLDIESSEEIRIHRVS